MKTFDIDPSKALSTFEARLSECAPAQDTAGAIKNAADAMAKSLSDYLVAVASDAVFDELLDKSVTPEGEATESEPVEVSFLFDPVPESAMDVDIYSGMPNVKDLASINRLTGEDYAAEEWSIYCYRASDNLLHGDESTWHPNLLRQMADKYVGYNFMIDHNWGSSDAVMGFVVESKLYETRNPSDAIMNAGTFGEINKQILSSQGKYQWLMLKVAVPAGSSFDMAAKQRRTQFCSTGFFVYNRRTICPDCSAEMGREIEFTETEKIETKTGTEYRSVCPHLAPSPFLRMLFKIYARPDQQPNWSTYSTMDGDLKPVELSAVVSPMLPACGILR
jgi:hypothetical protein